MEDHNEEAEFDAEDLLGMLTGQTLSKEDLDKIMGHTLVKAEEVENEVVQAALRGLNLRAAMTEQALHAVIVWLQLTHSDPHHLEEAGIDEETQQEQAMLTLDVMTRYTQFVAMTHALVEQVSTASRFFDLTADLEGDLADVFGEEEGGSNPDDDELT